MSMVFIIIIVLAMGIALLYMVRFWNIRNLHRAIDAKGASDLVTAGEAMTVLKIRRGNEKEYFALLSRLKIIDIWGAISIRDFKRVEECRKKGV